MKRAAFVTTASTSHGAVFLRMGKNIAWLLGGRGFVAVTSLFYLAIAARTLGPADFGTFSLILAYGQIIATMVQFQSWQGVIRYGALHLARRDEAALSRMLGFTATLDAGSALVGAALALAAASLAGSFLGWAPADEQRAAWFGVITLLAIDATPQGILRLLDRFDLIAYCQAVAPALRLIGSLAAWAAGAGIAGFLLVWAIALAMQSAMLWIVALGPAGRRLRLGRSALKSARAENPGIFRFMVSTNFSSSLGLFGEQLGTLAIGGTAGAVAAGGFRLASRLAKAIAKPIRTLARVVYPEFARLVATGDHRTIRHVVTRASLVAAALAALILLITGLAGDLVIEMVAGEAYRFAHLLLFLLAIASAIELAGLAVEPLLNAHGRAGTVLAARAAGAVVYTGLMALLLPLLGPPGAAVATIAMALVAKLPLVLVVVRMLGRR
jgi:O-antigen/teichoic acid export membrane protein